MKNLNLKLQLFFVILICAVFSLNAQSDNVGIGTTSPNASSILELQTSDKGFLPPRMTTAQRNAITSPATGLIIYNTTTNQINLYNGSAWIAVLNTNNTASNIIKETISKDVANVAASSSVTEVFTLTSTLSLTSSVRLSPENALNDGLIIAYARVSGANTVEVKFYNASASSIDLATMNFYITVIE